MEIQETLKSQYRASLEMLRQSIVDCPDSLWLDTGYKNPFWHIAYHALFYTHLYLQPSEDDFIPWEKHKPEYRSLSSSEAKPKAVEPYSKEEVLAYHKLCCQQVVEQVAAVDLEAESGFYWLPFDKVELQLYNVRHIQLHTGELCERLGAHGGIEVGWVGMDPGRME